MTAGEDIVRDDTDEISDDTKTEPAITDTKCQSSVSEHL